MADPFARIKTAVAAIKQQMASAGFLTGPVQYAQNLGLALKNAGQHFGPMIGRGAMRTAGGIAGMFAGGGGSGAVQASSTGKVATGMNKLANNSSGLPKVVGLFHQLVAPAALLGAVALLKKFTFGLSDSNRDLAKWNGALAASFARLDIAQMRMDIQTAQATSGTGSALNDALADVILEFQPIREDLGILVNLVGISATQAIKTMIGIYKQIQTIFPQFKEIVDGLHILEDEMKKKTPGQPLGNQALNALTRPGFQALPDDVHKAQNAWLRDKRNAQ